jgi:predicted nucleic acid-binding protein
MQLLVDATPLYDLGQIGELDLLDVPDVELVIPTAVIEEVDVEPAATNLDRFLDENEVTTEPAVEDFLDDARGLLDDGAETSDVVLVAVLLAVREDDEEIVLVSADKRLRAIAEGLGATVTSSFGLTVRASIDDKYFSVTQAKRVIRRMDHHGVQMTGRLRERAIGEVDS